MTRASERRPVSTLILTGLALLLVFSLLVVISKGSKDLIFALVIAALAVGLGSWLWRRGSRAALITTLIIGALHGLEQAGYLAGDAASGTDALGWAADAIGLIAGLTLVVGAALDLRRSRRAGSAPTGAAAGPSVG